MRKRDCPQIFQKRVFGCGGVQWEGKKQHGMDGINAII